MLGSPMCGTNHAENSKTPPKDHYEITTANCLCPKCFSTVISSICILVYFQDKYALTTTFTDLKTVTR